MAADLVVVPSEDFAAAAADSIAGAIRTASRREGPVSLALSGGTGPRPVYQRLGQEPGLAWERIEIYFADERAVPPGHPDSNYGMVLDTLIHRLPATRAVHRMEADRSDLDRAADAYAAGLPGQLDVLVLGMGEDGHTASLFPHHAALREESRRVLAVEGPALHRRLTITPPVIRAARAVLMLVSGERKAAAVARALDGGVDPDPCPARLARNGTWVLDEPAASLIGKRT